MFARVVGFFESTFGWNSIDRNAVKLETSRRWPGAAFAWFYCIRSIYGFMNVDKLAAR